MAPDVTLDEVWRLARAMTLKNAAAGLAHGGGKAGIIADPTMPAEDKERLVRAFGRAIQDLVDYIPGPDMGTDETCMAYLIDEMERAVGLPRVLGGIPLDEIGATGFGCAIAAEVVQEAGAFDLQGARVVVQGFGAVGQHGARFLQERGAVLVAASDSKGAVYHADGLDLDALRAHKAETGAVTGFSGGEDVSHDALFDLACEIWLPAARPDVIGLEEAKRLQAKVILQGANIPATPEAEELMHTRGIISIPDFIANAGGVICAAVEYHGGTEGQAFATIEEKIRQNTAEVLARSQRDNITTRAAALALARARVEEAFSYRAPF